jgi:capsular polysaccharide biosynthesis protein
MTRLPPALQPLWPAVKRMHRAGARTVGAVARRAPGLTTVVPHDATAHSRDTAAGAPTSARYHVAGPAFTVRRAMPTGTPPDHWYFALFLEHEVPERFVLDLDGGSVVGPHSAIMTREGILDYETSHYFGTRQWREHPVFLNPRPAEETFDGTLVVLTSQSTSANYYHFLMDALPRLDILEAGMPNVRPDAYLVDGAARYHRELVALLGLDRHPMLRPRRGVAVQATRLLVPSLPNRSTVASPETTAWLSKSLPPRATSGLPERLYITRGGTKHTRRVDGEDAVFDRLERRGFTRFDPGSVSVQDQIDHFAAARVIVSPHGAALTNLNFCRPGVRLLELFAPGYVNAGYWSILGNVADSHYRYLVARTPAPPRPGSANIGVMHDIHVTPEEVDDALDELLQADQ